jgi:hypothetical protein
MRNFLLAAAAVSCALLAAPVLPASAGSYGHHHGYYHDDYETYRDPPPVGVVYRHYLPDEDSFGRIPRHYVFKRHVHRYYYREPSYRYYSSYRDDSGDDCRWLKRRAKHSDSRYWWKRYQECKD